ncbi:MAG: hypothetical protein HWQ35_23195 [Nostoc sp. NMS1]|uniref:hypothetical protein n=1 Tax=Nostoc sp. NMS2 TaxID=2815389 RepID=UPI0025D31C57|nr:hypothetical protein [Nostoc sp. NMS2]MBN3909356.1 hypothetical protein [Nostoc sp. NMS1]MBN3993439.1 hypothetical protein [Nostoc sp. NMS2]
MGIILFQSSSLLLKDLTKYTARAIAFCKNAYWLAIALGLCRDEINGRSVHTFS